MIPKEKTLEENVSLDIDMTEECFEKCFAYIYENGFLYKNYI